jgi:DNA-binding MarR family transcriptional regulator
MLYTACAFTKLRRSARIVGALYDEALAPAGLSAAQYSLLRMIERAGPSSLTGLAGAAGYDRTTLNRTLRPLEAAGLVRSAPGGDRRARIVEISEVGAERISRARPLWEGVQKSVGELLGPGQGRLFALLDRIERLRTWKPGSLTRHSAQAKAAP